MNMYVESCHEKKGMHLVRHNKRQAKDEEETKFCAKKWRTYLTTTKSMSLVLLSLLEHMVVCICVEAQNNVLYFPQSK